MNWLCVNRNLTMPCISRKLCIVAKAFHSLGFYLVLIVLLNNLQCSTSALSTTVPSVLSSNFSSHEPTCSNVKDLFAQRGIADKDLPAKFPIKGENGRQWILSWRRCRVNCEVKTFSVIPFLHPPNFRVKTSLVWALNIDIRLILSLHFYTSKVDEFSKNVKCKFSKFHH